MRFAASFKQAIAHSYYENPVTAKGLQIVQPTLEEDHGISYPIARDNQVTRKQTKTSIGFELTDEPADG